jgi:hypothetical protein
MWRFFRRFRSNWRIRRLHTSVQSALALNRHGEFRPDGLSPINPVLRLQLKWHARGIHPWDSDLSLNKAIPRFVEQTLLDADAGIRRLFELLPEIEAVDLRVLETNSDKTIMAGTIDRKEFEAYRAASVGMRLRMAGVNYRLVNSYFEPVVLESEKKVTIAV